MSTITINDVKYTVTENLKYQHSVGAYAKMVHTDSGERVAIKRGGVWVFWGAEDRVRPLQRKKEGHE